MLGAVAEWLRSGLQSREHRFESGPRLQELIRSSSVVEQAAVNRWVGGSNPSSGAKTGKGPGYNGLAPCFVA